MLKKIFDYNGQTKISIEGKSGLIQRISENIESEASANLAADCFIKVNEAEYPIEIVKDKKYPYLTVNKKEEEGTVSIRYTRYNTHIRTIYRKKDDNYTVDTNLALDEAAGLICLRNYLNRHHTNLNKSLMHASLIELNGRGILIPGGSRQGKTTLGVYLMQEKGGKLISDENIILNSSDYQACGVYVPKTLRVRFSAISESTLSKALNDISLTHATQYIDPDAIERIIKDKNYNVDAGLAFSRKAFCALLGTTSKESSKINSVIFPIYMAVKKTRIKELTKEEGIKRLSLAGLNKKSDITPKELQACKLNLNPNNYKNVDFFEIAFSNLESLLKGGLNI